MVKSDEARVAEGLVAIVTGGTRGIGRAIAQSLASAGADVLIAARDGAALEAAAAEIGAEAGTGSRVIGVVCDVRDPRACRDLVDRAAADLGGLHILINNAGIGRFAPVEELSVDDWRAVIATNLDGVFYLSNAAIPHIKRSGGGWIINIGSLAGRNAFAGGAAYNASKFGLLGFTEALMQEVRHDGIRVCTIMPGSVVTQFRGADAAGAEWKVWPEDVARIVVDLLAFPDRALPSRIEIRPSRPPRR